MSGESWENVYGGLDIREGYIGKIIMEPLRRHLPAPTPPYRCRRQGHRWKTMPTGWPDEILFEACVRCARGGLITLRTTDIRSDGA